MRPLTSTSYGVLALLAMRPWSAYELSNEGRRYLSQCLGPRAETSFYQEPKNLVEQGFARAKVVTTGRRSRTVYSITPQGRRELRKWFRAPSVPPKVEIEALAKAVFAEHGSRPALLATLAQLEGQVQEMRREGTRLAADFFDTVGLTPERLAVFSLAGKLYFDHFDLLEGWARGARAEVENWPEEWPDELTADQLEAFRTAQAPPLAEPGPDI